MFDSASFSALWLSERSPFDLVERLDERPPAMK